MLRLVVNKSILFSGVQFSFDSRESSGKRQDERIAIFQSTDNQAVSTDFTLLAAVSWWIVSILGGRMEIHCNKDRKHGFLDNPQESSSVA